MPRRPLSLDDALTRAARAWGRGEKRIPKFNYSVAAIVSGIKQEPETAEAIQCAYNMGDAIPLVADWVHRNPEKILAPVPLEGADQK